MEDSLILQDGRILAYAQYGAPGGKSIFLFHGMPGSRRFHPPDEITRKLGVRLITVDRPGCGLSTFRPNRRILDWPGDVIQLADHLRLDQFAVAGHSGGGAYALACACALPDRVTAAALICAAGPRESPGALERMTGVQGIGYRFGRSIPWLFWRALVWAVYRNSHRRPAAIMEYRASTRPRADAELWQDISIRNVCYDSVIEAFRNGTRGHAWDSRLITRPWNVPFEASRARVDLWHGTSDRTTPVQMAYYLADKIPNCRTHYCTGEAHLLIFPHWEEILLGLLEEHR